MKTKHYKIITNIVTYVLIVGGLIFMLLTMIGSYGKIHKNTVPVITKEGGKKYLEDRLNRLK